VFPVMRACARLYNKVASITVRQLAVRDSHGKFVVEVDLRRLSV
jgi:hypothetical protein